MSIPYHSINLTSNTHNELNLQLHPLKQTQLKLLQFSSKMVDSNNYRFSWKRAGILPRVGMQGKCSCCVMFACTSLFSSICAKNTNGQTILFSKQQIIDCLPKQFPIGKGDSQGCYDTSFSEVLSYVKDYGLCREYEYPYQGKRRSSPYSDAYIEKNKCLTLGEYEIGLESYPEQRILATIDRNPIMGVIPIFQTLQDFSGNGIYMGRAGIEEQKGCHAVLITGYGVENGIKYYEIQNSWGIDWGDRGFARVSRSLFRDLTAVYDIHCKDGWKG
ncbi:hypothetical protein LIER_15935 [Lithospermum erythrorhizon]|uniref:Peptidase C1A papain C-terminal domain-containing protein n=1 Tax=Lithospermum erythrorhizon TaxID=34254 RepID=A0AAV3Q9B9_LITER